MKRTQLDLIDVENKRVARLGEQQEIVWARAARCGRMQPPNTAVQTTSNLSPLEKNTYAFADLAVHIGEVGNNACLTSGFVRAPGGSHHAANRS